MKQTRVLNLHVLFITVSAPASDVGLVFASSDGSDNLFKLQKEVAQNLVKQFLISKDRVLVGVAGVASNNQPQILLKIGDIVKKAETLSFIESFTWTRSSTVDEISLMVEQLFDTSILTRPGISKTAYIFLGKEKIGEMTSTERMQLQNLEQVGVKIAFVIIGELAIAERNVLLSIVKNPDQIMLVKSERPFTVNDIEDTVKVGKKALYCIRHSCQCDEELISLLTYS